MGYVTFEIKPKFPQKLENLHPSKVLNGTVRNGPVKPRWTAPIVRRPLQGVVLKERAPAYLTVLRKDGSPIFLNNSIGGQKGIIKDLKGRQQTDPSNVLKDRHYTDFTLLEVSEERAEKIQVAETFGEHFVFMFGESPRILAASGVLMNTLDFNWRAEFWENYDLHMRGTRLVEQEAKIYLSWDDVLVGGYMLNAQAREQASSPHAINFAFSLLVTDYVSLAAENFDIFKPTATLSGTSEFVGNSDDYYSGVQGNGVEAVIESNEFTARNRALIGTGSIQNALLAEEALSAAAAQQAPSDAVNALREEIFRLVEIGPQRYPRGKTANAAGRVDSLLPATVGIGPFNQEVPRVTPYQTDVVKGLTTLDPQAAKTGGRESWKKIAQDGQMFTSTRITSWTPTADAVSGAGD